MGIELQITIAFLLIASFIAGMSIGHRIFSKPAVGCIHVDETNPEKDLYTFEFYIAPYQINELKSATFDIRRKNTGDYRKEVNNNGR